MTRAPSLSHARTPAAPGWKNTLTSPWPTQEISSRKTENGTLCTNPPYGERLLEKEAAVELMRAFGKTMRETENWKTYVISSLENFENVYGKRADKRRRLYNGMIPCQLYMYL